MTQQTSPAETAEALVRLLLQQPRPTDLERLARQTDDQPDEFARLCISNRVLIRSAAAMQQHGAAVGKEVSELVDADRRRVDEAMSLVGKIGEIYDQCDEPFTTIKTLDQYPDQGHDVDLLVGRSSRAVHRKLVEQLHATTGARSVSELLAAKTNYNFPNGFTLEVHRARLGQVGEHDRLAMAILEARQPIHITGLDTWAPSPEGRVMLAMLQRIYRHFNFRICDVVNLANLMRDPKLDWTRLRQLGRMGGVNRGVAAGLVGVHQLLARLGIETPPPPLLAEAQPLKPTVDLAFRRGHFRFALLPVVPRVYLSQLAAFTARGRLTKVGRIMGLGAMMAFVGLNIRLAPSVPVWRRLW